MRKQLIAWQWSDYDLKHSNKFNFLIHIIAVPLFWLGTVQLINGLFVNEFARSFMGLGAIAVSFIFQGIGHKLEKENPAPFLSPFDFITRFITEQFVTFPRFVLSLKWTRLFRKSKR